MWSKEHIKLLYRAWRYRLAENNEINYLLEKIKKGDTVLDVGAHKGAYTYWMKKSVGKNGKVIAFEPQQKGAALLQSLFSSPNVRVEHVAISDKKGVTQLNILSQSNEVSYEASLNDQYQNAIAENVSTTTLDDYCSEKSLSPAFIKIDVEGHEKNVMAGAMETLKRSKPILLIEIEARHIGEEGLKIFCKQIIEIGYAAYFFSGRQKLSFKDFNAQFHQDIGNIHTNNYSNNFVFEPK